MPTLAFILLLFPAARARAETVRLTDGSVLRGTVRRADAEAVELETPDGVLSLRRERIVSIDYAPAPEGATPAQPQPAAAPSAPEPAPAPAAAPDPAPAPPAAAPAEPKRAPHASRMRGLSLSLEFYAPANGGDGLHEDFQTGANAVANIGYAVSGSIETKSAIGGRIMHLLPVHERADLGASFTYIRGPESEGRMSLAGGGLSGVFTVERSVSYSRFLLEERTRFAVGDATTLSLGGGLGFAFGKVSQDLVCTGSACVRSGQKTTDAAGWAGFAWELSPELIYHNLLVGVRLAGFPSFAGNPQLSEIRWTTFGAVLGAAF